MTACPRIPRVLFCRQWRSADEIEALASRWRAEIARAAGERAVAAVVPGTPEGVALIAALSSLPFPAILLAADRRALPGQPPLPPGTAVVVPPSVAHATPWVEQLGGTPHLLPEWPDRDFAHGDGEPAPILRNPGFVMHSSGSTGANLCTAGRTRLRQGPRRGLARSASALETASLRACLWRTVMG